MEVVGGGGWWSAGEVDNVTVLAAQHDDPAGALESADLSWAEGYNDSLSTAPTPLGNTSSSSRDTQRKIEYCTEWSGATLTLFQVSD
ncbi:hypothetical protein E2C01_063818 [Portunus trituberculatus]|uniref:Uncharacterized protein n=1 Tax=Portunus trituberculatus TaxID=210409 RepID=A0A5B7HLK5_PORTR|nr:hypothetical protein [Portunus trituberculatus]